MVAKQYFFDTYALAEIVKGNPRYAPYANCECSISQLNLIELYYAVLRDFNKQEAEKQYIRLKSNTTNITDEDIFSAMELKLIEKKDNLSYADCIGYAMAKRLGMRFLTGDEKFATKANVEYVK